MPRKPKVTRRGKNEGMETIHHSEDEIDMLLRRGKKIEKVQYAVSDEDEEEEYQRYHGFNFGMSGF